MKASSEHKALEEAYIKLKKQAVQLAKAKKLLEERNRTITEELALASELQKSLLPRETPADLPLTISHRYLPFLSVGGDYYDYISLGSGKVGIIIADASGHGVASAFLTAMMKSAFTHIACRTDSPAQVLTKINEEFCRTIRTDHYITAFYIIVDTENMECVYANAGHPKQIIIHDNGEADLLSSPGFFLGTFETTKYEERKLTLQSGDRLMLYTDGLLETTDSKMQPFGRERLLSIIRDAGDMDIELLSNEVITRLLEFMGGEQFQDDITLLTVEFIESL